MRPEGNGGLIASGAEPTAASHRWQMRRSTDETLVHRQYRVVAVEGLEEIKEVDGVQGLELDVGVVVQHI